MSKALYRKYRSKSLDDILGQGHVTSVLSQAIAKGKVAHAYLLTGPRGVGKTSIARILAHEINQLPYDDTSQHLDIIEIDAASNNGVEDVRDLRDKVQIAPVSAKRKVYIIDEVHMLSKAAFNALLKTLEEPPEHVVFILATTDIEKLPATIISRTQRFSLRAITPADATKHLAHIASEEGIKIEKEALELIARRGDGSFRDSISLLDQLSSLAGKEEITRQLVEESLGLAADEEVAKLLEAHQAKDLPGIVALLNESEAAGVQPTVLTQQLIEGIRAQLFDKPQLLPLMDALLDVPKSSQPGIKLLTVLATHSSKPKNAALSAPAPSVSASVEELKKKVTLGNSVSLEADSSTLQPSSRKSEQEKKNTSLIELDWPKLVEYTREHYVAIYSVLSKCSHEINGDALMIYTVNAFYKKKLDDTKYRVNLLKSLVEIGVGELSIETIPTPPPPKDSTAASVAAIMGGGEEVSVGEVVTSS
jgi:DNA polymerase-3 subunit gamma/tau